jgi:hypothetical protein
MWPSPFFVKSNALIVPWKQVPNDLGYFCNLQKAAQSKQSLNRRKFAQSGHPAWAPNFRKNWSLGSMLSFSPIVSENNFGKFLTLQTPYYVYVCIYLQSLLEVNRFCFATQASEIK